MTELEAINIMLQAVGQPNINDASTDSYIVSQTLGILDTERKRILKQGHSFNTDTKDFTPDINGQIALPSTYFDVRAPEEVADRLAIRNHKLWDRSTQTYYNQPIQLLVVIDVPYEELPELWAEFIAREAAVKFDVSLNGPTASPINGMYAKSAKISALNSRTERANVRGFSRYVSILGAYSA